MKLLLLITSFCGLLFSCSSNGDGKYGEAVKYYEKSVVKFPDFDLTYMGERKQTANFPNGNSFTFTYFDFKIKTATEEKTVSWTSGTGEIAPAYFEIGGAQYMLELRSTENGKKKIDDDEVVITKK
jgi:hypothetical protein